MSQSVAKPRKGILDSLMLGIEKLGNKLPTPFTLFFYLFCITAAIAWLLSVLGVSLVHPATGEAVVANNLFTLDGLNWILNNLVTNFTGYAPLGLVLTMTLGIGLCEEVGLVSALIRKAMTGVPAHVVPYAVAFIGVMGNIASDSASVIIPPLAAMAFIGVGKNPIAGMICGYAGTNAGFTANLLIAGTDALCAGITNAVLDGFLGKGVYNVQVVCNWYFMIASTFLLTAILGTVSNKIVEPRLGKYSGEAEANSHEVTPAEKKALGASGIWTLVYVIIIAIGLFTGVLMNPKTGGILDSPFLKGLIPILFALFIVAGIGYGLSIGYIKSERDISKALTKRIAVMASYIVFVFSSAQFVALFNWTKLGTLLAIAGADGLKAVGFTGLPMIVVFILMVACINLLIGSSSAKWTLLAPIFVPMFMMLGYDPAYTQVVYRIGDSATNILSPMSAYLFMMLSMAQEKYDKNATLGTFLSNLFPHSIISLFFWIILLIIWSLAGLPFGPGAGMFLPAGIL